MACSCCGLEGVTGTCSMCYGDPGHNTDGVYAAWLEEQSILARPFQCDELGHERDDVNQCCGWCGYPMPELLETENSHEI